MNPSGWAGPPVIYLDVDGVITTDAYQRHAGKYALDPARVAIVAGLVREFGARVVVSSTWRVEDCRPGLIEAGLPMGCFLPDWRTAIPATSRDQLTGAMLPAEHARRGDEIAEHATRNGITDYVVLDDVDIGPAHVGRHVRPDAEIGLSESDRAHAQDLLAGMTAARHVRRSVIPLRSSSDNRFGGY